MKILKRVLNPNQTVDTVVERFSFRVQDNVEIYEHESQQTAATPQRTRNDDLAPRLIIAELARTGTPMLTKTRAEISGLNGLLRAVMSAGQPVS